MTLDSERYQPNVIYSRRRRPRYIKKVRYSHPKSNNANLCGSDQMVRTSSIMRVEFESRLK